MASTRKPLAERILHWLFEASLVIKGLLTGAETLAGLGLLLAPNALVARLVYWLTHYEIAEDPTDTMAAWTRRAVENFPIGTQHFYAMYLIFHGGLKLGIVLLLWRRVMWAYPAGMVVLSGFVAYEIYEFLRAGSPFLLVLAAFDLIMIGLVWQEYRALKSAPPRAMASSI
jgi:uncharacterized membrane protein